MRGCSGNASGHGGFVQHTRQLPAGVFTSENYDVFILGSSCVFLFNLQLQYFLKHVQAFGRVH